MRSRNDQAIITYKLETITIRHILFLCHNFCAEILRKTFLLLLRYSGKDISFLYVSGKEGGRRGREGGKNKGGSVKFELFVLRVEMIMRRKEQTKKQIMGFSFRKVTAEKQRGPRYLKQQHAKSTEIKKKKTLPSLNF